LYKYGPWEGIENEFEYFFQGILGSPYAFMNVAENQYWVSSENPAKKLKG
jgi:hypothetical protein